MEARIGISKIIIGLSVTFYSLTSANAYVPDKLAKLSLKQVAVQTLRYALADQIQDEKNSFYLKGEFPTKIQSTLVPALVGVGKAFSKNEEASAFTTASVINVLSQIYLDFPQYANELPFSSIPLAVQDGIKTYSRYQDGFSYNFYPPRKLENGTQVRQPIDMTLFPLWLGFTNIPNDSDTTSAVISSLYYQSLLTKNKLDLDPKMLSQFSNFLDENRNPMFYNKFQHRKNTGAFMTWFLDEHGPTAIKNSFAKPEKGARIPFVKNDVDCVVNANILKMLNLAKATTSGHQAACAMLNDMLDKDENSSCGVYYPNSYNLGFAISTAVRVGESCIRIESTNKLVEKIIKDQTEDGSWSDEKNIWKDPIVSTAFAMTTLLQFGDKSDARIHAALIYGTNFLLKSAKLKNNLACWDEENFFTATAIARSLIMWKSKGYTNGIIAAVLLKMDALYPQYTVDNYIKLKF